MFLPFLWKNDDDCLYVCVLVWTFIPFILDRNRHWKSKMPRSVISFTGLLLTAVTWGLGYVLGHVLGHVLHVHDLTAIRKCSVQTMETTKFVTVTPIYGRPPCTARKVFNYAWQPSFFR